MNVLEVVGIVLLILILWMAFDIVKGAFIKSAPRKPSDAGDDKDYGYDKLQMAVWLVEHPDKELHEGISYVRTGDEDCHGSADGSCFEWVEISEPMRGEDLSGETLIEYIKPAVEYMAKRYDCSDFRAIWLCKLKLSLSCSTKYASLLTPEADDAIRSALTGFKYWLKSPGEDSMCYYSENHQMVFAVSEYFAGKAYPDAVFAIDGRTGREHAEIAVSRMNCWFDQRARYGFSEFLSSNYLAVDIGTLAMLLTYCGDEVICRKAETALNMILLDYALQMYELRFSGPAGRNYARNNTSFMACYASHAIADRIWNTGKVVGHTKHDGFAYLFTSLLDSGRYSVPEAIVSLGCDNSKGVIRSTSGLTLKEMQQKGLIGQSDYCLMFQLGMGALSNGEVIENTLKALDRYNLVHNNFVSAFRFFNIRLLRLLGLGRIISDKLAPFTNGMAIQRNEVYTYCCNAYKLSTNQMYFPGSCGAQQLQQMACLPGGINVFTANPIKNKEFQGYGVAPCAAQDTNCMLSIYDIPKKRILMAPADTRNYTSTYFPAEKFNEVVTDGRYVFGRAENSYIALIGASQLRPVRYNGRSDFEHAVSDVYALYEGEVGPYVDSFRLKNWTCFFELRQEGNSQFTIYELGCGDNETFSEFMARVRNNRIEFANNVLTYVTRTADLGSEVTYKLDYTGSFYVNGGAVSKEHDRYDSEAVHALRDDATFTVKHAEHSYTFDLTGMYMG